MLLDIIIPKPSGISFSRIFVVNRWVEIKKKNTVAFTSTVQLKITTHLSIPFEESSNNHTFKVNFIWNTRETSIWTYVCVYLYIRFNVKSRDKMYSSIGEYIQKLRAMLEKYTNEYWKHSNDRYESSVWVETLTTSVHLL